MTYLGEVQTFMNKLIEQTCLEFGCGNWASEWSSSAVSNSLRPHGLWPTRLLRSWDFPDKGTGVGCHFLLQGIFLTQGLNPGLPHCGQALYPLSHQETEDKHKCCDLTEAICPVGSADRESACDAWHVSSISGSGRSPGEGNGSPLQVSCLKNPMDREAWRSIVYGVAKSRARLGD